MMASTVGVLSLLLVMAHIDWASSCPYDNITGVWEFHIGNGGHKGFIDCKQMGITHQVKRINLLYPDLAVDEFGNRGRWTTIISTGLEVLIHGRSYLAKIKYTRDNTTYYCRDTQPGWTHEIGGHDWACFEGHKVDSISGPTYVVQDEETSDLDMDQLYEHDPEFIDRINAAQDLWTAGAYPEHETMTLREMRMRNGWISPGPEKTKIAKASRELKDRAARLPDEFDWRNVDSVNYMTPVRNQGACGSCYAFTAAAMAEARLRIRTRNEIDVILSPQDIADCSPYAYGCQGGFLYPELGPYGEAFGMVEEHCNPYRANITGVCETDNACRKYYLTDHQYVGGYFGASNEENMRLSLVQNGPLAIAFLVTEEFTHYRSGIFKATGLTRKFDPYVRANHAVVLVGYGVDQANGTKFWSVKNSWGTEWGEEGYFRIVRGTNELNIEGGAIESFPVF